MSTSRPVRSGAVGRARVPQRPRKRRPRPRWGRIALVLGVALALCGGLGSCLYLNSVNGGLSRTDPFSQLTKGRPVKTVAGVQNLLLVGTDVADPDSP